MSSESHLRVALVHPADREANGDRTRALAPGAPEVHLLHNPDRQRLDAAIADLKRSAGDRPTSCAVCGEYALVAWHDGPIGVDLERIEAFQLGARTPLGETGDPWASTVGASKGAMARALGGDGESDPSRIGSPIHWRSGRSGPWRAEELDAPAGYVAWVCWRVV